ncbi:hypothetical protein V8E54_006385 [Elaphomyces granulatus]
MMEIPPDFGYEVDKKHLGKSFDPANAEHHTEGIVNGYIYCMLTCYRTIYRTARTKTYAKNTIAKHSPEPS